VASATSKAAIIFESNLPGGSRDGVGIGVSVSPVVGVGVRHIVVHGNKVL
jgi:hypothetical protein